MHVATMPNSYFWMPEFYRKAMRTEGEYQAKHINFDFVTRFLEERANVFIGLKAEDLIDEAGHPHPWRVLRYEIDRSNQELSHLLDGAERLYRDFAKTQPFPITLNAELSEADEMAAVIKAAISPYMILVDGGKGKRIVLFRFLTEFTANIIASFHNGCVDMLKEMDRMAAANESLAAAANNAMASRDAFVEENKRLREENTKVRTGRDKKSQHAEALMDEAERLFVEAEKRMEDARTMAELAKKVLDLPKFAVKPLDLSMGI